LMVVGMLGVACCVVLLMLGWMAHVERGWGRVRWVRIQALSTDTQPSDAKVPETRRVTGNSETFH
jgi:hypothetical protein